MTKPEAADSRDIVATEPPADHGVPRQPTTHGKVRVIIADDHPIVRSGLRSVIEGRSNEIAVIAEASNGLEAVELALSHPADVMVLDVTMPGLNGIEAMIRIKKILPDTRVLILSVHDTRPFVAKAMAAGACGYLLKDSAADDIVTAIMKVYDGGRFLSPAIEAFADEAESAGGRLSERETQVLELLCRGMTGEEIAENLFLSAHTVKVHIKRLMAKLEVHRRADLVRIAFESGLVIGIGRQ